MKIVELITEENGLKYSYFDLDLVKVNKKYLFFKSNKFKIKISIKRIKNKSIKVEVKK